jgi:hypothetical protein
LEVRRDDHPVSMVSRQRFRGTLGGARGLSCFKVQKA